MPVRELSFVYGINAGSSNAVTIGEQVYQPDNFYSGGSLSATEDSISGTVNDALYQTERYGDTAYEIPVTNGVYTVVLHFAEVFHQSAGLRGFTVSVEGSPVLTNLDLYKLSGHDTAFEYWVTNANVQDGRLSIALTTLLENATISGIAIYSDWGGRVIQ